MKPIILIHISDPHIDANDNKNKSIRESFSMLEKFIEEKERTTDNRCIILITGDIGNNAKAEELNLFSKILEEHHIADRVIMVPGNHDSCRVGNEVGIITFDEESVRHYQTLQATLLNRCRQFIITAIDNEAKIDMISKPCEPFINGKFLFWNKKSKAKCTPRILEYHNHKIVFVLLDSNPQNVTLSINFAQGEVGKKQMKLVKDIATNPKYKGWIKIALLHHHPIYNNYFLKLQDADEFLKIIWDTFSIVCFGHKHAANIWSSHDGFLTSAPSHQNNRYMYLYSISPDNTITQSGTNLT
jgi:predicted phosphodiesterase